MGLFNNHLALSDAIGVVVSKIRGNYVEFFVDTEFADIGIEVTRHKEKHTVKWSDAPFTEFYKHNRDSSTDFYMAVPRTLAANMDMLRLFVTREMLSIFIFQITGKWVNRDSLDAALLIYNEYIVHDTYGCLIQSYVDFRFPKIGFESKLQSQAKGHAACMLNERYERIKLLIERICDKYRDSMRNDNKRFNYSKGALLLFMILLDITGLKDDKLNDMPPTEGMTFTHLCRFYIAR